MRPEPHRPSEDQFLTPREVARIFGVRAATIARWAREGKIAYQATPGGHRRYQRKAIQALLDDQESESVPGHRQQWELDAVRMYDQGWSIRQVSGGLIWALPSGPLHSGPVVFAQVNPPFGGFPAGRSSGALGSVRVRSAPSE